MATMPYAKASMTDSVVMLQIGIATGQRERRSTAVNRYLNPFDSGIVTKSMSSGENALSEH